MIVKFLSIHIHHFLSFDDATIDLQDKGYCLVSGVNKNPKDCAKSNGSGKSTLFNALSFALTGETLQGLKSNLANIYFEDGCYVELDFEVNNHHYKLLRSKDDKKYGTDLKIYIDNEDKSGKGIRESNALLSQYLPDLTSELLGSTILIGQGMPMKFTANSPSGRKEVLEHLSQSDFMIQDLKDRITRRINEMSNNMRSVEDSLLELATKSSMLNKQLETSQQELEQKFSNPIDFDALLKDIEERTKELKKQLEEQQKYLDSFNSKRDDVNTRLLTISKEKDELSRKYIKEHQEAQEEFNTRKISITSKIYALEQEITRIKNIKDVCPLCGQKLPNVVKQDTTQQESDLANHKKDLESLQKEIKEDNDDYQEVMNKVNNKFDATIDELLQEQNKIAQDIKSQTSIVSDIQSNIEQLNTKASEISKTKEFYNSDKQRVLTTIDNINKELEQLKQDKEKQEKEKSRLEEHSEVLSKMNTIIKRDFRGFLLKNVIDYINNKAKEYASQIFGCDEIKFELDGNDINISFCDKDYENLSGGEKRRIDLIIQFAIRNFMCQYLNFSSNILVLDEIFDELDSESCDKVINFVTNELKDVESVFIISHHSDSLDLPVDSQLIVEKNELGVSHVIF